MTETEDFIYQFEGNQREVLFYFHRLLTVDLNLIAKIRYKIPFYFRKSWICYLNPTKHGLIELAFPRGNELSNSQGLLSDKGRKQVYSVEFEKISEIPESLIHEILYEAIMLDDTKPYRWNWRKK